MRPALSSLLRFLAARASFCLAVSVGASTLVGFVHVAEYLPYADTPDRDAQALRVDLVRIVPRDEALTSGTDTIADRSKNQQMEGFSSGLTVGDVALLDKFGVKGRPHKGPTLFMGGSVTKRARMLIVVTEPLKSPVLLRQPKAVDVVYLQRRGTWIMIPSDAPTLRKNIRLSPAQGDSTKIKVIVDPEASSDGTLFTWYPPMTTR
jgi:hypothetical protein